MGMANASWATSELPIIRASWVTLGPLEALDDLGSVPLLGAFSTWHAAESASRTRNNLKVRSRDRDTRPSRRVWAQLESGRWCRSGPGEVDCVSRHRDDVEIR